MLVPSSVIQSYDDRACQCGATEREEVVGRVVEQHTDVQHAVGRARAVREEEVRPSDGLGEEVRVCPRAVLEVDRSTRGRRVIGRVAA